MSNCLKCGMDPRYSPPDYPCVHVLPDQELPTEVTVDAVDVLAVLRALDGVAGLHPPLSGDELGARVRLYMRLHGTDADPLLAGNHDRRLGG